MITQSRQQQQQWRWSNDCNRTNVRHTLSSKIVLKNSGIKSDNNEEKHNMNATPSKIQSESKINVSILAINPHPPPFKRTKNTLCNCNCNHPIQPHKLENYFLKSYFLHEQKTTAFGQMSSLRRCHRNHCYVITIIFPS